MKVEFPKTNLVKCVFSFRQNSTLSNVWDKFDHRETRNLKQYIYRVPECLELREHDTVLVHCTTGYQLCEVVELNVISGVDESEYSPVVCKVDLTSYLDEVENAEKIKYMRLKLEKKKKELESRVTYDLLAERSPEFAEILKAFRDMGGKL